MAFSRSETLAIMGGDESAFSGTYKFYDDDTTMTVSKLGGKGVVGKPHRIGDTELTWLPVLGGTIGYIQGENKFKDNPILVNNLEKFSTFAAGMEAGTKIFLTDYLSVGPTLGLIYSRSESEFVPGTPLGERIKNAYIGQLFNWDLETITLTPSIDILYEDVFFRNWKTTFSSRYSWFNTWDTASSSIYLAGNGSSYNWETRADFDVKLPLKLFDYPLHTGGFVSIDILGGDFRDTVATNTMYTFNGRLVLGELTGFWKLRWFGLGASYIEAKTFSGYSFGLDAKLQF